MPKVHIATSREVGERCIKWANSNLTEEISLVPIEECDVFISVMYDKLIPQEFIATHRCYNIHPGYLPDYRGSGAFSWAIINGESTTGVTLHIIDKDIDHGPIIDRRVFPILETDTAWSLFAQAEVAIYDLFTQWFEKLSLGIIPNIQPNIGGHVYLRKDLDKAKDLTRFVRAFTFPGKESCYYFDSQGVRHDLQ